MKNAKYGLAVLGLALVALTLPGPMRADNVIYNSGAPDQYDGWVSDTTFQGTGATEAMSFVLSPGASTVTDAEWWGGCVPSGCSTEDLTVAFYTDDSGMPGTPIASFDVGNANQTATGNNVLGLAEYVYTADFGPLALTPGTTYWFSVQDDNGADADYDWFWETTNETGTHADEFPSPWGTDDEALAFNLTGPGSIAAPEPSSLLLVGTGLLGLLVMTLFRKRLAQPHP